MANAQEVFEKGVGGEKAIDLEKEQEKLYKKIGQLQIEVDFLKKALS